MSARFLTGLISAALVGGCATAPKPNPGQAAVVIDVLAKPKTGADAHFARVPVYDAAPIPAKPTGQFEHVDYASLGDIVIWLEPAPREASPKNAVKLCIDPVHPSSDIHSASIGQEIVFHNAGLLPLRLYSVSDGNDFELPPIAVGAEGHFTARGEGLIEILADPSQPPVTLVYVAPSPWVATTRAGKRVSFNNVPPGAYHAVAWHPRLPGKSVDVSLAADQVTHDSLSIGVSNIVPSEP